jgi:hypothetical protein
MRELSIAEQNLVSSAREKLGENLTQFLTVGLDQEITHSSLFTIEFTAGDINLRREVQIDAYDQLDIPATALSPHTALVILALLHLLILKNQMASTSLYYELEEILALLGWEDNTQSRSIIDEAVTQYSNLTYRWSMGANELTLRGLAFYQSRECFISGYSFTDEEIDEQLMRTTNRVDFSRYFIDGLRNKSLFDLDWDHIKSLTFVPTRL